MTYRYQRGTYNVYLATFPPRRPRAYRCGGGSEIRKDNFGNEFG